MDISPRTKSAITTIEGLVDSTLESLKNIENEDEMIGCAVILSASIALFASRSPAEALWILDNAKNDLIQQNELREEEMMEIEADNSYKVIAN